MSVSPTVESRTQQIGRAMHAAARTYRPSAEERVQDWLILQLSRDPRLQSRMLRFIDALAALEFDRKGSYVKELFREYFKVSFPESPFLLQAALRFASSNIIPAPLIAASTRKATRTMARRFITGQKHEEISGTLMYLEQHGRYPSFDILGEQVLSQQEAAEYTGRYLEMIANLGRHPWSGKYTRSGVPRLQLSIKLTALTENFNPLSPEGTLQRVMPRLSEIVTRCMSAGIGLTIDAEEYEHRELTWYLFSNIFAAAGPFGGWDGAGMVVQAYHCDADSYMETVLRFAETRPAPFQVRLVKGAYWDYETISAREKGWPSPVFSSKEQTDLMYEKLLDTLLKSSNLVRLAAASHNIRSHAVAEALRESHGLAEGTVEHQALFRTAEGISRAISKMGWENRDYVPAGELVPGMAYLVRRVLENASQAGFLMRSRMEEDVGELLRPPGEHAGGRNEQVLAGAGPRFRNSPPARLFLAEERIAFRKALEAARNEWGQEYLLEIGNELLATSIIRRSLSPSHPDVKTPVGIVHMAGPLEADKAVAVARQGLRTWSGMSASERASIILNGATLLRSRREELAAWVVHEGGRTWTEALADVDEAVDHLNYNAEQLIRVQPLIQTNCRPRGVVAVIPPWNFPAALPSAMTSAALLAGNTVILKSAEQTPVVAARLVRALHDAGVPRNALVHLPGYGYIGKHLVESTSVDMIAFTGSKAVGKAIYENASRVHLHSATKKVLAEMGGKNPIVVFPDADIDEAIRGILLSAFEHSNQKCSACSQAFVHKDIYARLRDRLKQAAISLQVGMADDPDTLLNPLIDRESSDRVRDYAAKARSEGRVLVDRIEGAAYGPLHAGPLIVEIAPDTLATSTIAQEEIFGPILALVSFENEREMLAQVNGTAFALTAGVFSRSPKKIGAMVKNIRAGNIYVNRKITGARVGVEPFGGFQLSGTGPKAGGGDYLLAYLARTQGYDRRRNSPAQLADALPGAADSVSIWNERPETRRTVLERAVNLLGALAHTRPAPESSGSPFASEEDRDTRNELVNAARAVVTMAAEVIDPQPTLAVPGQVNYVDWSTPRGIGFIATDSRTTPGLFCAMVFGPLLAGNGLILAPNAQLMPLAGEIVSALREAGVPTNVVSLASEGGVRAAMALAGEPFQFAVTDMGLEATRAVLQRLAVTYEDTGQKWLKALISMPDSLRPGETGFVRNFALPKTIAIRTLRHGADMKL